jgi:hypothetical protein
MLVHLSAAVRRRFHPSQMIPCCCWNGSFHLPKVLVAVTGTLSITDDPFAAMLLLLNGRFIYQAQLLPLLHGYRYSCHPHSTVDESRLIGYPLELISPKLIYHQQDMRPEDEATNTLQLCRTFCVPSSPWNRIKRENGRAVR